MFKVNSKYTRMTPMPQSLFLNKVLRNFIKKETLHWHRSGVFNINFEHIAHIVLVFLLLTEHVIAGWVFFLSHFRPILSSYIPKSIRKPQFF